MSCAYAYHMDVDFDSIKLDTAIGNKDKSEKKWKKISMRVEDTYHL